MVGPEAAARASTAQGGPNYERRPAVKIRRGTIVVYYYMLTVPEVAARTGRDPETIRRWIRTGKLRARKIGTQHVVEKRDLDLLLNRDTLPLPRAWRVTSTREPMPHVVEALRRSRGSH
jgi:excisionase family DNA binding protein